MTGKSPEYWAVIPASGSGQRMQAGRPKQYLTLGTKTIIEQTLDNLLSHPQISGVVLILSADDKYWSKLNYQPIKPLLLTRGGAYRHHSVFNGLQTLVDRKIQNCITLIHDAVRPFVTHQDLDQLLLAANEYNDGAILAAPVADTLKLSNNTHSIVTTQSRENLWRAFTPQVFKLEKIFQALDAVIQKNLEITDDASAMELAGFKPQLICSDSRNIKITHPQDLQLAELILSSSMASFRHTD